MSFLLEKANQNHLAIDFLIDKKLLAPAVHCGYYSCFQKIDYVLKEFYTDERDQLHQKVLGGKGNLHGNTIKEFTSLFRRKFDRSEGFELDDMLKELKEFRKKSDYDDEEITEVQIEKVKQYVTKIHRLIKKHMQV
jgi:Ran GTPase-activating protein (RanGAP) involved in mRNA processing and transport